MIGRTALIGGVLAAAIGAGAVAGAIRSADEAARLPLSHPDYFAWEACAQYLPRWLGPFMRECVAEIRAAQEGKPAPQTAGMANFMICSYGMSPQVATMAGARDDARAGSAAMETAGVPLIR